MSRSKENSKAAQGLVRHLESSPGPIHLPFIKESIKSEIGISRIGEARIDEILELVKELGQGNVSIQRNPLTVSWSKDETAEIKAKERTKTVTGPSGHSHMGMLLSAQLKREGEGSAFLFHNCPHCGGQVRVTASVGLEKGL